MRARAYRQWEREKEGGGEEEEKGGGREKGKVENMKI